jgi:2-polyprenyl-6-methoxyphenol hydroxylase-like FAD-dependent oxidoreductase
MRQSGDCVVVIIGGGPCGLMLAIELGRRGVSTIVLEEKSAPSRFPSANATQARIMEHYRRLGFAEKVRARGLPPDYPTDTAYFSRYTKYELARFSLPSARQAREIVKTLTGSWSAAELPHRVSQVFVEDVLRDEAAALSSVRLRPGWRMIALRETGTAVEVDAERSDGREQVRLQAAYVLGADGGGSPTRKALGYGYLGESGVVRDFIGGRMFAVHIRSSRLYDVIPHPRAWMYWAVNRERRGLMPSVNGRDEFTFHTQLRSEEKPEQITDAQAKLMFQAALGTNFDVDIVARSTWNVGHTLVAEKFQRGRIFLGGDAARAFSPRRVGSVTTPQLRTQSTLAGNSLPCSRAGVVTDCWPAMKPSGRRSPDVTRRTRAVLPIRSGCSFHRRNWKTTVPAGEAARKRTSDHFNYHARFEFNIPGITFGGRYDGSPIIVADDTLPPPDRPNDYVPTACPGGRAPHLWLADGRSLYDPFGFEFTLLQLGTKHDATPFETAAKALGLPLSVVSVPGDEVRDIYQADLALIRPDQIVAWRGNSSADAAAVLRRASGHG